MKDFDTDRVHRVQRDRKFQIGGEEFTYLPSVRPEAMADWNEGVTGEVELGERKWLELFDSTIIALLEPGQEEKWRSVRENADPAINLQDLQDLMKWLLAEQSGRPTGSPSDSTETDGPTTTESTATSSPLPAAALAT